MTAVADMPAAARCRAPRSWRRCRWGSPAARTLGLGKRLGGQPGRAVAAELQPRTAEQLFAVLGQLKGGAMKFGQALSVFEAALPEEIAAPYRAALTKLQEAAPPMPARTVHAVLAEQLGARLARAVPRVRRQARRRGQHRPGAPGASGATAATVAVKIQYPGAGHGAAGRPQPARAGSPGCSPCSSRAWTSSR